jgi:PAS domain S-box-containing protein
MNIATAVADDDGRLIHVSPALCRLHGYEQAEMLALAPSELLHPDDRELAQRTFANLRDGSAAEARVELRLLHKDGGFFPGEITGSVMTDPLTARRLRIFTIHDLSERRRLEHAYAEERHLFDEFLANVPFQVYFKDRDSRFLRVSNVQARRLGFEQASELVGKTDFDVFGSEHAEQARADEEQVMSTGRPIIDVEEREVYIGEDSGSAREPDWVLTTKLPLRDSAGDIIGTFGVSHDITLRKRAEASLRESEERWRSLLAHLQEIVVLADAGGHLIYATPSMQRWLGYAPEELVGVELGTTTHPDDLQLVSEAFQSASQGGRPTQVTHRVRHRDGSWRTLESTIVSLAENPAVGAVLFASTDVTDRILIEHERERMDMERRVSHRLEAVGQLAAGIAHEINTPLQFVGDSVVFLREAVDDLLILAGRYRELLWIDEPLKLGQRREIMQDAEEHADIDYLLERIPAAFERTADGVARVREIVQAMKRFSHPSSGEIAAEDLGEAIQTTLAVCRNEYKYVAEVELALGDVPPVPCNLGEINQVLLNLVINAAQAIGEQRDAADEGAEPPLGRIRISTSVDGDYAVIQVEDDGPGIPAELQERIYEPFFTTKEVGKGTGQGLALARTTVARHDGLLECESAPGQGTTFRIRLPLKTEQLEQASTATGAARQSGHTELAA